MLHQHQHQHQGSYDSTDSGSLPPTYSRLPPDGDEFPEGESLPLLVCAVTSAVLQTMWTPHSAPLWSS